MPNQLGELGLEVTNTADFPYIYTQNASVPLVTYEQGVIRVNIYRPKGRDATPVPALVTYGPYGKDVAYANFAPKSFAQVNPEHKSEHSCWETPDPQWWTSNGYAVVRADERGICQSPGVLDTMSRSTSEAFFDVVEWTAKQAWCSGKVGLLGISYYAGSQWRVAARRPKGLAAIVPWEGMSDYYRDRVRQGGILSNRFIKFWWEGQVIVNQYGRSRKEGSTFPETIEGRLSEEELKANLNDQTVDTAKHRFRDEEYYVNREYPLEDIEVPLLSVANWGGISLHLRGNVEGFAHAGSKLKYLRFITGRHDLPFYYAEEVEMQKSFLDAFLKGEDRVGWATPGKVPPVSVILREGDVGFNDAEKEKVYKRREESAWPLPSTKYTKYHLSKTGSFAPASSPPNEEGELEWKALDQSPSGVVQFTTAPFEQRTEFTGHVTAHLNVSIAESGGSTPSDLDLFVSIRHISPEGKEVFYTGTAGDPVPVVKGWLRCSLRKVNSSHPWHRPYLPYREYHSTDVQELKPGEVYPVDVEIWPTNVVVSPGGKLIFEISGADTQGAAMFAHEHPEDRSEKAFAGLNRLHFGVGDGNYVTLPLIP